MCTCAPPQNSPVGRSCSRSIAFRCNFRSTRRCRSPENSWSAHVTMIGNWNPFSKACLQNNEKLMRQRKDQKGYHNQTLDKLSEFHLGDGQIQGYGTSWLCTPPLILPFSFHLREDYEKKQQKHLKKKKNFSPECSQYHFGSIHTLTIPWASSSCGPERWEQI